MLAACRYFLGSVDVISPGVVVPDLLFSDCISLSSPCVRDFLNSGSINVLIRDGISSTGQGAKATGHWRVNPGWNSRSYIPDGSFHTAAIDGWLVGIGPFKA
jgi:hypothetical protein